MNLYCDKFEVYAGSDIYGTIKDAKELAVVMQREVVFSFNGVELAIKPNVDIIDACRYYETALKTGENDGER